MRSFCGASRLSGRVNGFWRHLACKAPEVSSTYRHGGGHALESSHFSLIIRDKHLLSVGNELVNFLFVLTVVGCAPEGYSNWHAIGHQNWAAWGDLCVSECTTWMLNFVMMMDSHSFVSFQYRLHSQSSSSSELILSLCVADLCPRRWLFFIHNSE